MVEKWLMDRDKPQPVRRCDSCQWWQVCGDAGDESNYGLCRAALPHEERMTNGEDGWGAWLKTQPFDWCYHWAQRPDSGDST